MEETIDIGKAGEFAVVSEMLFRGFNASIMSVDTGIDIVAIKDGHLYLVQVKTARKSKQIYFYYDIRMKPFERFSSKDIFYIFVMRDNDSNSFLILPALEVQKQINDGKISTISGYDKYRVVIISYNGKVFIGNRENEVTYFFNNWSLLK